MQSATRYLCDEVYVDCLKEGFLESRNGFQMCTSFHGPSNYKSQKSSSKDTRQESLRRRWTRKRSFGHFVPAGITSRKSRDSSTEHPYRTAESVTIKKDSYRTRLLGTIGRDNIREHLYRPRLSGTPARDKADEEEYRPRLPSTADPDNIHQQTYRPRLSGTPAQDAEKKATHWPRYRTNEPGMLIPTKSTGRMWPVQSADFPDFYSFDPPS